VRFKFLRRFYAACVYVGVFYLSFVVQSSIAWWLLHIYLCISLFAVTAALSPAPVARLAKKISTDESGLVMLIDVPVSLSIIAALIYFNEPGWATVYALITSIAMTVWSRAYKLAETMKG